MARVPNPTAADELNNLINDPERLAQQAYRETFRAFGEGFAPATDFKNTTQRIYENMDFARDDSPPASVENWECRIGLSKFYVPPISIQVSQQFKSGNASVGALRQNSSPKFTSGHSETTVSMTLYFPNYTEVWGVEDEILRINFESETDARIDKFMSSLRGLITQFKYAPFLPVRNQYLNQNFGITGLALKDMTLSTVPNFPFCIAVNLVMYKFNHRVYMPMIDHFDQAIHWGRFRQYMGKAVGRLAQSSRPVGSFANAGKMGGSNSSSVGDILPSIRTVEEILAGIEVNNVPNTQVFNRPNATTASWIEFAKPFHSPAAIELPDTRDLRPPKGSQRERQWWDNLLGVLGINTNTFEEAGYDKVSSGEHEQAYLANLSEARVLSDWLHTMRMAVDMMGQTQLNNYYNKRLDELNIKPGSSRAIEFRKQINSLWFYSIYRFFLESPALAEQLARQNERRRFLTINEWEVPVVDVKLDPDCVSVQGVSVTMGNLLTKLQLQMQSEPTHQHIGGADTVINVAMRIHGHNAQQQLVELRTMFDEITGLARLEHGHGVLGFLAVKNIMTELCGVRYVVPLSFEVDTVPNAPGIYDVRISMVDFDVFQNKRESLNGEQQAQLIDAFGKHNPFLRLKQLWGFWNPYPDLPLSVRDEDGKVVGSLDPDYYFRSFKGIDDDIVNDSLRVENKSADPLDDEGIHFNFGDIDEEDQYVTVDDGGVTFRAGDEIVAEDVHFVDQNAGEMHGTPFVEGLTPGADYMEPVYGGGGDPWAQYEIMSKDMQYRDKSGRMVRAFPTFMMWFIDEGGKIGSVNMFDQFYGLQSVLEMSMVTSEDSVGDTLIVSLSNLYSKLSTPFHDYLDETSIGATIINEFTRGAQSTLTGTDDRYVVDIDTIRLAPGARIHLRMGYGGNPNRLDTVFNGTITEVQQGDVITFVAQSDAMELSALVETANEKSHSGRIDGSLGGLSLSEPRDLMITLLTQSVSKWKDVYAHASRGEIFSENRYGIKHFGAMLYTYLDGDERDKHNRQRDTITTIIDDHNNSMADPDNNAIATRSDSIMRLVRSMAGNMASKRDYEIFKRNIYPGNGMGISQYLGGDAGDIGMALALMPEGADGQASTDSRSALESAYDTQEESRNRREGHHYDPNERPGIGGATAKGLVGMTLIPVGVDLATRQGTTGMGNFLEAMGLKQSDIEDDEGRNDEVSFRAVTYMKSVWDLFKVCANLLPDYIVAVRPFEDRSTIFYGKPHWLYTSGVIPLTQGRGKQHGPAVADPNEEFQLYAEEVARLRRENHSLDSFEDMFSGISRWGKGGDSDPNTTTAGTNYTGDGVGLDAVTQLAISTFGGPDGISSEGIITMIAIAKPESDYGKNVHNLNRASGDDSYGIWQINMRDFSWRSEGPLGPSRRKWFGIESNEEMKDPRKSAAAAYKLIKAKQNAGKDPFSDWSTYNNGHHLQYMAEAREAYNRISMINNQRPDQVPAAVENAERTKETDDTAKELIEKGGISEDEAEHIWQEINDHFATEEGTENALRNSKQLIGLSESEKDDAVEEFLPMLTTDFIDFLWENPYARAWAAKVPHRIDRLLGQTVGSRLAERDWDLSPIAAAFQVWINSDEAGVIEYMENNHDTGRRQGSWLFRFFEHGGRVVADAWDAATEALAGLKNVAAGLIGMLQLRLGQLTNGASMAANMEAQTNALNKLFNDSLYYSAGTKNGVVTNPLLYYADNPFTREYGEPVVEIREPFQRMHMIGSFRHILHNGIIETIDGVPTVVTANSNGKDPVTVHFDKAMPPDRQFETVTETGLVWNQASGFFDAIFNPINSWSSFVNRIGGAHGTGDTTSSETSAKRIALAHLKEGLKGIYQGEIIVLGDASIRPYDMIYMADTYNRMYGYVEARQVVHTFDAQNGFITSVTPAAPVSINDPARFYATAQRRRKNQIQAMRDHLRNKFDVYAKSEGYEEDEISRMSSIPMDRSGSVTVDDISRSAEDLVLGSVQYVGGKNALAKDSATMPSFLTGPPSFGEMAAITALNPVAAFARWKAWTWVRDNLLDQHGCYISYLTHNGKPMDAGLSYAQGVAVGHQRASSLTINGLKLLDIPIAAQNEGGGRVKIQDVIGGLQWDETDPNSNAQQVSSFVEATILEMQKVAQPSLNLASNFQSFLVKIDRIVDSDTFVVEVLGEMIHGQYREGRVSLPDGGKIRCAGAEGVEDPFKNNPTLAALNSSHPGVVATNYAKERMPPGTIVALRMMKDNRVDMYERGLGFFFHYFPNNLTNAEDRAQFMLEAAAGTTPSPIAWDSYSFDGRPYTWDRELIDAGHASVYETNLKYNSTGGVVTPGQRRPGNAR